MISQRIFKIGIVGPESTGKSTLSMELASHYQTVCVSEYARKYMMELKRPYTLEDIVLISQRQLEQEVVAVKKANRILFCDTTLLVSKIWALHAFQQCPPFIEENWKSEDYDLLLLLQVDIPWQEDPLREHPHLRQYFFDWYERELKVSKANYKIIAGSQKQRVENAVEEVHQFLLKKDPAFFSK